MYPGKRCFTPEEWGKMQADEIEWAMLHAEGCSACRQIMNSEDKPDAESDPSAEA
jgi:hypothetical protein